MNAVRELSNARVPLLGIVAPSGTGKTTLLRRVLSELSTRGLRVGVIKQARADFEVDQPDKDSYKLRKAGVEQLLLAAAGQSALILEHSDGDDPSLNDLLMLFDQDQLDLILVEGFAEQPCAKIELQRGNGVLMRYPGDASVIAIATDQVTALPIPILDINDPVAVADFVLAHVTTTSLETTA